VVYFTDSNVTFGTTAIRRWYILFFLIPVAKSEKVKQSHYRPGQRRMRLPDFKTVGT
jgi:hypothetical protein